MITATARMLATLVTSHAVVTSVDVMYNGAPTALDLRPVEGEITADRAAQIRRTGRLSFVGRASDLDAVLLNVGAEMVVRQGVLYGDGTVDTVQLGVFRIEVSETYKVGASSHYDLTVADRSASVRDARFTEPISIASGTNYQTAVQTVLTGGLPAGTVAGISATGYTTPALVFNEEGDRWEAATQMATSMGSRIAFNNFGNVTMSVDPGSLTPLPVAWDFDANPLALLSVSKGVNRNAPKVYNAAVVIGAAADGTPVRGVVYDTDASSSTFYGGPFGRVPIFYRSSMITTAAQALDAANALLARSRRFVSRARFTCLPMPHLEDGDVVVYGAQRYQIQTMTLSVGSGPMILECTQ